LPITVTVIINIPINIKTAVQIVSVKKH